MPPLAPVTMATSPARSLAEVFALVVCAAVVVMGYLYAWLVGYSAAYTILYHNGAQKCAN
jgi:hypothetical protein